MSNNLIPALWGHATQRPDGATELALGASGWAPFSVLLLLMVDEKWELPFRWLLRFHYAAPEATVQAWCEITGELLMPEIHRWDSTFESDSIPRDVRGLDTSELGQVFEESLAIVYPETSFDSFVQSMPMADYNARPERSRWRASRAELVKEALDVAATWFRSKGVAIHPVHPWAAVAGYEPLVLAYDFNP